MEANDDKKLFSKLVPEKILPKDFDNSILPDFGFELDIFQKQGIYYLNKRDSVFIAAHTSSGKTILAHFCIINALRNGQKVIYTSPIKALSNQKYYEFRQIYSKETENVGIVTGDVQINEDAPILIMTTEILRNRLFKNTIENLSYVIFDEIHYINDKERGVVWEESIIQLDKNVCLLFLSATISNPLEFSEWVGRIKNKTIHVIKTEKRVIPLEYFLFKNMEFYDLNGKKIPEMNTEDQKPKISLQKQSNIRKFGNKQDQSQLQKKFSLTLFLQKIRFDSLPAIFFNFSRNKCEEYMNICSSISFIGVTERKKILDFLTLNKIESEHRKFWIKGIASHHSGLIPIEKEAVELLFQQNLIKILFATETMAMGLNMPAKSVIFLHPFKKGKLLATTPFLQMSGRAGRRGLDKEGKVFINFENCTHEELKKIIYGQPEPLISTFKISFNLILNLLKYNFNVLQYLKHSFSELSTQRSQISDHERKIELEKMLKDITIVENFQVDKLIENFQSIRCGDFVQDAEWAVDFYGNCGLIDHISSDAIHLKTSEPEQTSVTSGLHFEAESVIGFENMENITTVPFLDILQLNNKLSFIKKSDCFIVGKGDFEWENALQFLKNKTVSGHALGMQLIETLNNLSNLKKDILQLNEEIGRPVLKIKFSQTLKRHILNDESKLIDLKHGQKGSYYYLEYEKRAKFLEEHKYIEGENLLLKGQIASEIRTLNDIVITEMLFHNDFDEMTGEMIIALFSCMICNEKEIIKSKTKISEVKTSYNSQEYIDKKSDKLDLSFLDILDKRVHEVNNLLIEYKIQEPLFLNYTAVKPIYLWCQGKDLRTSTENEITKGGFVRVALRLHESIKEMQNVCNILQNNSLLEKLRKYESILVRDVICQESLYLKRNNEGV
ncbi:ski2 atp-dependent rna helicase [Pseudoloma neurophilia]|uniref:Ski2 atp-dependent rna helicase n=1 Tax=Pseudoloma neurophilia TaxID=146866 RepID=A0A0R0M255_9MICR|nr:ski2 atp-dependent rna helicase [Pseudoloma neurophilia]